ncbi:glycosyl transferase, group 1 [Caballeronia arvi]|uniref:Glycosyl transferase, group 1 n=1 Tax=Caballeronia arvi TaxID=1777135 RepID=A0A158JCB7_9BURK|nr:glycosyltransferase [Caballeronia arvi]SAL66494.1 glycosyl transferase, group 1 [Caballeronia arvi]
MNVLTFVDLPRRATRWARVRRWRSLLRDCKLFVPAWYRARNPDVAQAGVDELTHYLTRGWREGRNPGPEFDGSYYLSRYPDVAASGIPPLLHYWVTGRKELRRPNASMDLEWIDAAARLAESRVMQAPSTVSEGILATDGLLMSVIIPTYNRERLLPGVLNAWREVNRVTTIPFELLFSDDGSQDGSVALLESVNDLPIRVLRNEHGGASAARNAAIREARGQRLLIIGDDIFPDPELINVHWRYAQKHGPLVATLGVVDWHPELKVNHLMDHITEIGNEQFSYNRLPDGQFVDFRHFYTCNICVDRNILAAQETLFDHRFDQYGFEDVELGYRLSLQGLRLLFTREAKGDHFHPYVIAGFCRRQISAGKMAVVFRNVHPGVGAIVGVDEPERALKKGLPSAETEHLWQSRLAKLTERAEMYEHMFERTGRAARGVLGNCLSTIYSPLFRAMYEYGVLQRLAGTEALLSLAMSRHFGPSWDVYWRVLDASTLDLRQMPRAALDKTVEALAIHAEIVGEPLAAAAASELAALLAVGPSHGVVASSGALWRRRISTGLHYLRHDPRQLSVLVKGVLQRRRTIPSAALAAERAGTTQVALSSSVALIVDASNGDNAGLISRFAEAFGDSARVFERIDESTLREMGARADSGDAILTCPIDDAPCGVFYWPASRDALPNADALMDAWLAVVENSVDIAVISYGYGEPADIRTGDRRDHMMFSRRVAQAVLKGALGQQSFNGKIIRVEEPPGLGQIAPSAASEWFGTSITVDPVGYFSTQPAPTELIRFLVPQFQTQPRTRPVIFVFPVFVAVGGVERNTVEILRQLRDTYDFVVVTMERLRLEQGTLGRQFQEAGARLMQMSEFSTHADYLRVLSHLKHWLRPDLVWICNGSPWLADNASRLRMLFGGVPIVDQQVYDVDQGWITRYNEPGIRSFDRFIAVNRKIYAKFIGEMTRKPSTVDLIYSAINTDRIVSEKAGPHVRADILRRYGLPEDKRLFGFIARLTAQKRPIEFLRLANARRANKDEFFVLVGDGDLAPSAEAYIREHKLENVMRIPYVANTLELDSVLDGLIFTSAYEGLPIAMIEALSFAVPILSTDVGDIGAVLDEFNGGVVYPVDASPEETVEVFEQWLAGHAGFRQSLAGHEAAVLNHFSSRRIAHQYVDCFNKAMAGYHDSNGG